MIDLYGFLGPNARKIVIALAELGLPYRMIWVDITKGEQFAASFTALNPNAKVPALVDHDGPDGRRIVLFESAAILLYLAEKTGRLLPPDPQRRWTAVSWLAWQVANQGPMSGQAAHFAVYAPQQGIDDAYATDRYLREVQRLYRVLDDRLAGREYLADEFSVADIACFPWARTVHGLGLDLPTDYPAVAAWSARIAARPSAKIKLADPADGATERTSFTAEQFATLMRSGPSRRGDGANAALGASDVPDAAFAPRPEDKR